MGIKAQMGGLKRVNRGTVTAPRHFVASHLDGGTMRVTLQVCAYSCGCAYVCICMCMCACIHVPMCACACACLQIVPLHQARCRVNDHHRERYIRMECVSL